MNRRPWPASRRQGHGTPAAYRRHLRQGGAACDACKDAERRSRQGRRDFNRRNAWQRYED